MSVEKNQKLGRSARPLDFDPFTVQPSRPAPPPPTALKVKTHSLPDQISPLYISVLSEETSAKQVETPYRPARPASRRPVLSRGQRFSQSTETEVVEPSEIRNVGIMAADATEVVPVYETVLTDYSTPLKPPPNVPRRQAPPRPLAPPRPAVRPRSPFQSISEEPTEHLYEYMPDTLPDSSVEQDEGVNGETGVCTAEGRPFTPCSVRSWSEQSSVDGDSKAKELDILLEWWKNVEGWENLPTGHQGEESEVRRVEVVAHRVTMGMRLYQLLVFRHGKILLNHITELHCTADSLSRVGKNTRIAGITGGTTGAVGVAAVVAGVALAPFTFGASMVAAGIGVGVAAAGGVTGASAAITNKVKSNQVRSKVERILRNYRLQMDVILENLEFISTGMDCLRNLHHSKLKFLDACGVKTAKMAQEMDSLCLSNAISECTCILQGFSSGLDSYFSEEDRLRLKKGSETQFADKIREVADKLKEGMDELVRIKNLFHSVTDV